MDINSDGKLDVVAGDSQGNVWFFKNEGTAKAPKLAAGVKLKADGKEITGTAPRYEQVGNEFRFVANASAAMGIYSKIHVADWDGDGLLDLLVGQDGPRQSGSEIVFYRNVGTATAPKFAAPQVPSELKAQAPRPSPYLVDWDGDGIRDVLLGTEGSEVLFLRNTGTDKQPVLAAAEPIALPGLDRSYRCRIAVVDWNNDGKLDLLVGTFRSGDNKLGGNIWLFLRK